MNSLAEIEELRSFRSNVRRSLAALEVCWSCDTVGECTRWNASGKAVWLCDKCYGEQQRCAAESITRAFWQVRTSA
jgi:hypothetical protein